MLKRSTTTSHDTQFQRRPKKQRSDIKSSSLLPPISSQRRSHAAVKLQGSIKRGLSRKRALRERKRKEDERKEMLEIETQKSNIARVFNKVIRGYLGRARYRVIAKEWEDGEGGRWKGRINGVCVYVWKRSKNTFRVQDFKSPYKFVDVSFSGNANGLPSSFEVFKNSKKGIFLVQSKRTLQQD